jgi:hypothetical protein
MGMKGWEHAKRVLVALDKLLKQWAGMMVFKYVVVQRQVKVVCAECSELWPSASTEQAVCAKCGHGHFNDQLGEPAYVPLLQAQSARTNGDATVVLPPPTNAAWGSDQEEVRLEKLLGPADALVEREAGNAEEEEEEEEQEEEEHEEEGGGGNTIDSHGKVAGGAEEEEFEDYRVIIESMQKAGQQWIMLSYCWGERDKKTGQYDMQQIVIKVFRRLVKEHGLPVWLDIFGSMGGDVYESMSRGVRGAAVVVPFLSSAYEASANGKRELKFACNLERRVVSVMAEAGFNHNDSSWLGVCVPGELYHAIERKSELAFNKQVDDLAAAIKKELAEMQLGHITWPGAAVSTPKIPPELPTLDGGDGGDGGEGGATQQTPAEAARDMNTVASLLYQNSLSRYAQVFSEEGYDDVDDLRKLAEMEGEEWRMLLMRSKMKPPHSRGLRNALGVGAAKEATPPGSTPMAKHCHPNIAATLDCAAEAARTAIYAAAEVQVVAMAAEEAAKARALQVIGDVGAGKACASEAARVATAAAMVAKHCHPNIAATLGGGDGTGAAVGAQGGITSTSTVQEVAEWVRSIGHAYVPYATEFSDNSVDGATLFADSFGEEDLNELGVTKKLHQKRIMRDMCIRGSQSSNSSGHGCETLPSQYCCNARLRSGGSKNGGICSSGSASDGDGGGGPSHSSDEGSGVGSYGAAGKRKARDC